MPSRAEHSARLRDMPSAREPDEKRGVYRDVFEQSILLTHDSHRPRNFLVSAGAEFLVVAGALLIPLAFHDRLPDFRWKDITIAPPKPLPIYVPPATSR